ncbi:MAG: RNA degradosome polyphosphate kinase, partial [Oscillospiraceae bacterium]|nr:RNA degradosome polyphosphate kinase [Oscillospiraceae bacterium]
IIGADGAALFQNIATVNLKGRYQKLLASPFQLRDRVMALIDGEIAKGSEGYIFLKLNSLTDRKLIDKLAAASQAGVKIVMNIRGICCLRPGVPGLTENITVFSIVGRYLEHSRIYCFGWDRATAAMYISSADFMTRNTERRVEIACPVEAEATRRKLFTIMDELMADNEKARVMDSAGEYHHVKTSQPPRRCQLRFMQTPLDVPPPEEPRHQRRKQRLLQWLSGLRGKRKNDHTNK